MVWRVRDRQACGRMKTFRQTNNLQLVPVSWGDWHWDGSSSGFLFGCTIIKYDIRPILCLVYRACLGIFCMLAIHLHSRQHLAASRMLVCHHGPFVCGFIFHSPVPASLSKSPECSITLSIPAASSGTALLVSLAFISANWPKARILPFST